MDFSALFQVKGKPRFFQLVFLLGIGIVVFYLFAGVMVARYGMLTKELGWEPVSRTEGIFVLSVESKGEASGKLLPNDRVLALNGETRLQGGARERGLWLNLRALRPEAPYTVRVGREGREFDVQLRPRLVRDWRHFIGIPCYFAVSLAFFLVGMLIGLSKPEDPTARLASLASLTMASIPYFRVLEPLSPFFLPAELGMYYFTASVYPINIAVAFHFYYRFPAGVERGRLFEIIKYLLYGLSVVLAAGYRTLDIITLQSLDTALAVFTANAYGFNALTILTDTLYLLGLGSLAGVITRNYRLVTEPDQQRRIKLVVYSTVLGIVPFIIRILFEAVFKFVDPFLVLVSELMPIIIPVTLAYTIIKHRVLDIQVVIRRGVQYLLATNALKFFLALPIGGFVLSAILNPNRTIRDLLLQNPFLTGLFVLSAVGLRYRQQLLQTLDRKFFREAYDQEQIMLRLIRDMKQVDSFSEISKLVNREIDAALHPKSMFVFERNRDLPEHTLVYTTRNLPNSLAIPDESKLLELLEAEEQVLAYPFERKNPLPDHELEWLNELGINLIVPMSGSDHKLMGLLLLGEKKSEEAYSPTDGKLLQVIAGQMAVVYENTRLKERVGKEQQIKREVLARFEEQNISLVKECPVCGRCYDSADERCADDGAELALSLAVERTVEGKYRLDRLIGKGGMGAVYEAQDLRLNRMVAVKIILANMFGDQKALRRFEREARASAKLNHRNVIAVYDYGRTSTDGAFLVMELAYGVSLRQELHRLGALHPEVCAEWFGQILQGMKAAHAAGVIHRDLKPDNILLVRNESGPPVLKILDFGLAKSKLPDMSDPNSLTAPGMVMGTLGYMSPEQFSGEEVDERTDIFALGVMLVEALTGSNPFRKANFNEYLAALMFKDYHLPGASPEIRRLDALIQKCLAKDRDDRYSSVDEMFQELIPVIRITPPLATVAAPQSQADTARNPDDLTLFRGSCDTLDAVEPDTAETISDSTKMYRVDKP